MTGPSAAKPSEPATRRAGHVPVLCAQVIEALAPRDGATYVDGTFGGGGTARAILEAAACTVWGIDRDPRAAARAEALAADFPGRLRFVQGRFGEMDRLLKRRGVCTVDGVALDLGLSSYQLDDPARGFSFRLDGPLDMRMGGDGLGAADLVNGADEHSLADLIRRYGEERKARRIAGAIVAARRTGPIATTRELAAIIERAAGPDARRPGAIHPATRTFQALRIAVNDELDELARGLCAAERLLAPGGRLCVVSFHSLEDRRVKLFLRARAGRAPRASRHEPEPSLAEPPRPPSFHLFNSRVRKPDRQEIANNPRARSARLRMAERTSAAPWPEQAAA